jgi:hypothetical protein
MTKIRTDYEFSGVPRGTIGTVIDTQKDDMGNITEYAIQWDLPRPKPLVDWFTADEFVDYLQVIE